MRQKKIGAVTAEGGNAAIAVAPMKPVTKRGNEGRYFEQEEEERSRPTWRVARGCGWAREQVSQKVSTNSEETDGQRGRRDFRDAAAKETSAEAAHHTKQGGPENPARQRRGPTLRYFYGASRGRAIAVHERYATASGFPQLQAGDNVQVAIDHGKWLVWRGEVPVLAGASDCEMPREGRER